MGVIVRIDDSVLKSIIDSKELWSSFPKFEKLSARYKAMPKGSCRCRRSTSDATSILAEAKAYIYSLPMAKKKELKQFLKADTVKINIVDTVGRHKDYVF